MANLYLVCEGQSDAAVLAEVLRPWSSSRAIKVVTGQGRSPSIALARTLISSDIDGLALVLDADTTDPSRIVASKHDLESLLVRAGGRGRTNVSLFVPEFEALFFTAPDALSHALGIDELPEATLKSARFEPKASLTELLNAASSRFDVGTLVQLVRRLGPPRLHDSGPIAELIRFFRSVHPALPPLPIIPDVDKHGMLR